MSSGWVQHCGICGSDKECEHLTELGAVKPGFTNWKDKCKHGNPIGATYQDPLYQCPECIDEKNVKLVTEGVKFDQDKIATDLLPFDALEGTARVLAYGKKKYAARNWEKGMAWGRLLGAALRHAFRWAIGEEFDPESGLPHLDHFTCCALMLSALVKRKVGTDDRFKPSP